MELGAGAVATLASLALAPPSLRLGLVLFVWVALLAAELLRVRLAPVGLGPRAAAGHRSPRFPGWLVPLIAGDLATYGATVALGAAGSAGALPTVVAALVSPAMLVLWSLQVALLGAGGTVTPDARIRALLLVSAVPLAATALLRFGGSAAIGGGVLGSAAVVGTFVLELDYLYRVKQLPRGISRLLLAWPVPVGVLVAGWFVWSLDGVAWPLVAGAVGLTALVVVASATSRLAHEGTRTPWLVRPTWVFSLLLGVFLTDFFVGALLDLLVAGPGFLQFIPFVPQTGPPSALLAASLYDGLWFASAIFASAWFLVALAFTMGPLVVLKMRASHDRALRYRLGLTLAVFGLASIYIPSLTSSTPLLPFAWAQNLPVVGWGFGLRDGGPFEAGVFLAVVLMYVLVGALTLLFGRKALCSVLCGAALMYQGTTMSEMRQFNQTSRIGKYFLGSRLSTAYLVASGVALVSLFGVSFAGLLHLLPAVHLANGELDTATAPLPIMLYFGGLWFAMFVTTPFIGTYNCATTGFCHWGALSIPFAKVSMFSLKVRDRKVCQQCTTFDCAKACPVGLVDMPLHFRTTGEYRSTKCCGVGDCVGACPYGNMYHQDVRRWVLRRLGRAEAPAAPARGVPLPMVAAARPAPSPGSAVPRAVPERAGPGVGPLSTGGLPGPEPARPA